MAEAPADDDAWTHKCILSKQPMIDTETLTARSQGISNFIKSSKQRGDDEVETVLKNKDTIKVHITCSKTYNSKKALKKFVAGSTQARPTTSTRSSTVIFDFKNNCIFCEKSLHASKKTVDSIAHVSHVEYKDRLLQKYANVDTPQAVEFRNRLSLVPCLVEVGAAYHKRCMRNPRFLDKQKPVVGKATKGDVYSVIIDYITSKPDDSQFSLNAILSHHENINESPYLPTLKSKLQDHFQSDFIIQIYSGDIVISRMRLARFLLLRYYEKSQCTDNEQERLITIDESSSICFREIQSMKYQTEYYPAQDTFLQDSWKLVPQSLKRYLSNLIAKNKKKA